MIHTSYPASTDSQPAVEAAYDVVVIGAGPAGATTAALVAEYGHRVLVLERASFPRFHVGESLIPETYWPLQRLGLIDQLKQSAYPKKFSVQFVSEGVKESAPFYFDTHNPHESSQTWQIERATFDCMLLDKAIENGAVARTDAHVLDVLFDGDQATGVKVKLAQGRSGDGETGTCEIAAKVIVDATGTSAFLANRLGVIKSDSYLKKATVWSYFQGALRDEGKDEGATIILQTAGKSSWFWYIPLSDDMVSVGCTGSMRFMFNKDRTDLAEIFAAELERCPAMQRRLANATQTADFLTTKDYSYRATQAAGPGWLLVGDAFGFVDPVYSSGVFLALKSGEFAADAIHDSIQAADLSAQSLGAWQPKYIEGLELFRKLVYAFYAPDFSFGKFLMAYPQYRENLIDILIGAVFKPGVGEMFDVMGEVLPLAD
jgi:flavin-dependent dehydrogenase